MKNQKLRSFAVMAAALTIALALASCGGKGKLTIAGIGNEYKGSYIVGYETDGDFIFAASIPTMEDVNGVEVKKATVTLNAYELIDGEDYAPYTGDATILRGNLLILVIDGEHFFEDNTTVTQQFINNKVVSFEKGSAKINLAGDFELFD